MDPIIATARMGMMYAQNRLSASASRIAQMGDSDSDVDLTSEVADQVEAKTQFKANAQVVHIADQMWNALLDIQKS